MNLRTAIKLELRRRERRERRRQAKAFGASVDAGLPVIHIAGTSPATIDALRRAAEQFGRICAEPIRLERARP